MNGTKTFGGLIAAIVGAILVFSGVDISVVDTITTNLEAGIGAVVAIAGVALSVYGRLVAKGPILKKEGE